MPHPRRSDAPRCSRGSPCPRPSPMRPPWLCHRRALRAGLRPRRRLSRPRAACDLGRPSRACRGASLSPRAPGPRCQAPGRATPSRPRSSLEGVGIMADLRARPQVMWARGQRPGLALPSTVHWPILRTTARRRHPRLRPVCTRRSPRRMPGLRCVAPPLEKGLDREDGRDSPSLRPPPTKLKMSISMSSSEPVLA